MVEVAKVERQREEIINRYEKIISIIKASNVESINIHKIFIEQFKFDFKEEDIPKDIKFSEFLYINYLKNVRKTYSEFERDYGKQLDVLMNIATHQAHLRGLIKDSVYKGSNNMCSVILQNFEHLKSEVEETKEAIDDNDYNVEHIDALLEMTDVLIISLVNMRYMLPKDLSMLDMLRKKTQINILNRKIKKVEI